MPGQCGRSDRRQSRTAARKAAASAVVDARRQRTSLEPQEFLLETGDAPELTDNEQANLAHQNADHLDISQQLCTQILGQADGEWLLTGLDPEGMDFRCGERRCRLPFPTAAYDRKTLGDAIKAYLKEARARLGIESTP